MVEAGTLVPCSETFGDPVFQNMKMLHKLSMVQIYRITVSLQYPQKIKGLENLHWSFLQKSVPG